MIFLGAACLKESPSAATDAAGLLPTDITEQPTGADGGPAGSTTDIKPLLPSEFIFRRGRLVLAYDLSSNTERVLFDGEGLLALDLSPDRLTFVGVVTTPSGQSSPILSVSLDGRKRVTLRKGSTQSSDSIKYTLYGTTWSTDGSMVFFQFKIRGLGGGSGNTFSGTHANYFTIATSMGGESGCKTDGLMRAHPTDSTRVLLVQTDACGVPHPGLTEYALPPFLPVKFLVADTELSPNLVFDWLHDGSVAYVAKDGSLFRLDGTSGAKSVLYKPDAVHLVDDFAVGTADEIIVSLATIGSGDQEPPTNLFQVFPETGMAKQLTTDGVSFWPRW
jgi:hypothetical protein